MKTVCRRAFALLTLFAWLGAALVACGTKESGSKCDYLVLVNKENKLPEGWESVIELEEAKNELPSGVPLNEDNDYLASEVFRVEKKTLAAFRALQKDCAEDGVTVLLDSTYRSVAEQEALWADFAKEYGEDYCKKYVAVPGFSEHHTGLVIDVCVIKDGRIVNDNDEMIAERELFAKIHAKLAAHGFILRYLEGKEDVTGYAYEPWHFRYVGEDAAKEIAGQGLTLEEYLAQR